MKFWLIIAVSSTMIMLPCAAHAYIDPGSGSYILQITLAGLLAATYTIASQWRNFKLWVKTKFSKERNVNGNN